MIKMSTILTINAKDPETRVIFDQPLLRINEIQLIDYDFPEEYITLETAQTVKSNNSTLINISPGNYSFNTLLTLFAHGVRGINVHEFMSGYHLLSTSVPITFSNELVKKLNIINRIPVTKTFSLSVGIPKYHIHVNVCASDNTLGLISMEFGGVLKLKPTNLLAVVPSKSASYPSIPIQKQCFPINYLDLSILDVNGNKPNFNDMPFRISLRVLYCMSK